jgi:glutathione-regulated potassium-efflux system protein KefB
MEVAIIDFEDLQGRVLFIGFGRFAQFVSQALLARGVDVPLIETDVEMIQAAANFGSSSRVTQTRIISADPAPDARSSRLTGSSPWRSRSSHTQRCSRAPSIAGIRCGRFRPAWTTRSASCSSRRSRSAPAALRELGFSDIEVAETIEDVRDRDTARFEMQLAGGIEAGRALMRSNMQSPQPTSFTKPRREAQALDEEAEDIIGEEAN